MGTDAVLAQVSAATMRFRRITHRFGVCVLAGALSTSAVLIHAQGRPDLFVGTWKLDVDNSVFDPGPPPISRIMTIVPVDNVNQGWHLRVTVNADGAPGGDKTKVIWLSHCSSPAGTVKAARTVRATDTRAPATVSVLGERFTRTPSTRVLGETFSRSPARLPFTGFELSMLLRLAAILAGNEVVCRRRPCDLGRDSKIRLRFGEVCDDGGVSFAACFGTSLCRPSS